MLRVLSQRIDKDEFVVGMHAVLRLPMMKVQT